MKELNKEDFCLNNLEYEKGLLSEFKTEKEELFGFLDFVLEESLNDLRIVRKIKEYKTDDCPSSYYTSAVELGTLDYEDINIEHSEGKYKWVEWCITSDNHPNDFNIEISPLHIRLEIKYNSHRYRDCVKILDPSFFKKYNTILKETVIQKKKFKLGKILSNNYKVLGYESV